MDPFSTHQAPLVAAMLKTQGPILEMGAGWYSTPLVSVFANAQKRLACTVETSGNFLETLKQFGSQFHEFRLLQGYDFNAGGGFQAREDVTREQYIEIQTQFLSELDERYREKWSVVLIDQRPGFLRRWAIDHFINRAEFIVVHDTEHPIYEYEPSLSKFRYRCDFNLRVPATTIVSSLHSCDAFASLIPTKP